MVDVVAEQSLFEGMEYGLDDVIASDFSVFVYRICSAHGGFLR